MDDFSVFGASFENCLANLEKVLQRYEESNLVLNWEKCHFMVQEGIVLGHKISKKAIEVDKDKLDVIDKLLWRPQNNDWFNSNDLNNKNHGKFFFSFSFSFLSLFTIIRFRRKILTIES